MLKLFERMSLPAFVEEYKDAVQTRVDWDKLFDRGVDTDIMVLDSHTSCFTLYHPWFKGEGWYSGEEAERYEMENGCTPALLRIPAVRYNSRILVLDGNHRLRYVRPRFVVIDYLRAEYTDQARCFVDLYARGFLT